MSLPGDDVTKLLECDASNEDEWQALPVEERGRLLENLRIVIEKGKRRAGTDAK